MKSYIINFLKKLNYLLTVKPWIVVVISLCYVLLLRSSVVYADTNWEDQWIQGAPINKQPSLYHNEEDPRLLSEQMTGPEWRKLSDYYDIANNNPNYLGYGWNDEISSNESDGYSSSSDDTFEGNPLIDEQPVLIPSVIDQDSVFLQSLGNLSTNDKAIEINTFLYNKINNKIALEEGGITVDKLKIIVTEILLQDVTKDLWGNTTVLQDMLKPDNVGMAMILSNRMAIEEVQDVTAQQILLHMNTHILIINTASVNNVDPERLLNNPDAYQSFFMKQNLPIQ